MEATEMSTISEEDLHAFALWREMRRKDADFVFRYFFNEESVERIAESEDTSHSSVGLRLRRGLRVLRLHPEFYPIYTTDDIHAALQLGWTDPDTLLSVMAYRRLNELGVFYRDSNDLRIVNRTTLSHLTGEGFMEKDRVGRTALRSVITWANHRNYHHELTVPYACDHHDADHVYPKTTTILDRKQYQFQLSTLRRFMSDQELKLFVEKYISHRHSGKTGNPTLGREMVQKRKKTIADDIDVIASWQRGHLTNDDLKERWNIKTDIGLFQRIGRAISAGHNTGASQ